MARYSGVVLTYDEMMASTSKYILQISQNVYLDAQSPHEFEGRVVNCARKAKLQANVRYAAGYRYECCPGCGRAWVKVKATKPIRAKSNHFVELLADYGVSFHWNNLNNVVRRNMRSEMKILDSFFFRDDEVKKSWSARKITRYVLQVSKVFMGMCEVELDETTLKVADCNLLKLTATQVYQATMKDKQYFVQDDAERKEFERCLGRFIVNHRKVLNNVFAVLKSELPLQHMEVKQLRWWARRIGFKPPKGMEKTFIASAIEQFMAEQCEVKTWLMPSQEFVEFLRVRLKIHSAKFPDVKKTGQT